MRPPEFTGGNPTRSRTSGSRKSCFNEAAGIHRRKHADRQGLALRHGASFNEAAGIHRRKPVASKVAAAAQWLLLQ